MAYHVYHMPNGKWYWICECGSRSSYYSGGFSTRDKALDDLASHINFKHVGAFKYERDETQPQHGLSGLIDALTEYSQSREAIRKALERRILK